MGVPVVTIPGERFASRHSLSHLNNVGLGDLVADSLEAYLRIAIELADDLPRQSRQIISQFDGDTQISLQTIGDEIAEADIVEVAQRVARGETFARYRDDRHSHPQRLHRRR